METISNTTPIQSNKSLLTTETRQEEEITGIEEESVIESHDIAPLRGKLKEIQSNQIEHKSKIFLLGIIKH